MTITRPGGYEGRKEKTMKDIKVEIKTNGYEAEGIQGMIGVFEKVVADLFPGCLVRHFYYGDHIDMADIILGEPGKANYAHFNITAKRVSLTGYSLTDEQLKKCESLTHNDECYEGKLFTLAAEIA